jgi:hypothetical protein
VTGLLLLLLAVDGSAGDSGPAGAAGTGGAASAIAQGMVKVARIRQWRRQGRHGAGRRKGGRKLQKTDVESNLFFPRNLPGPAIKTFSYPRMAVADCWSLLRTRSRPAMYLARARRHSGRVPAFPDGYRHALGRPLDAYASFHPMGFHPSRAALLPLSAESLAAICKV